VFLCLRCKLHNSSKLLDVIGAFESGSTTGHSPQSVSLDVDGFEFLNIIIITSSLGSGCGNKTQLFSFLVRCIILKHDEVIENIVPRYEFPCFNSYQDLSRRVFSFSFLFFS